MRKILAITGIRSEYDIFFPVLKAIDEHPRLKLELVVTGAHLCKRYGYTIKDVKNDGFAIIGKVKNLITGDKDIGRIQSMGIQLTGLVRVIYKAHPDLILVVGDREEAMNAALIGQYLNIPVAHISGGDRAIGNVDDQIRHAVTKLAHIHFATNSESAARIRKMGEQPFRIFNTGNPGLDRITNVQRISKRAVLNYCGFNDAGLNEPLLLVIQHPLSTEIKDSYSQMKKTMEAIKRLRINTIINYPNSDAGNLGIIKCINEYKQLPFIRVFKNIPRLQFVNILRHIDCLIGNSSAGIIEAPFLKLPVVNVGNRQKGRLHAKNVQFVPHGISKIRNAIRKAVFDKLYISTVKRCTNPYGDGNSGKKIARILAALKITEQLMIKDITY